MKLRLISVAVLSTLLAACGGGSGSTAVDPAMPTAEPAPVVTPAPLVASSSLVTSVPAPSYLAGSEELAAFNYLNAQRNLCGFGLLAQNTALDQAAKGHADWAFLNNSAAHSEGPGTPGFTGIASDDRIVAAGYTSLADLGASYDELVTSLGLSNKTGYGVAGMQSLLNAPYHARRLISSTRDIGISIRNDVDVGTTATSGNRVHMQVNLARTVATGPQLMDSAAVATYPCDGSTGIQRQLVNETPNPVPGRDLAANPLGSSISIAARDGQTLVITSATMTNASTGDSVTLRAPVGYLNDPNSRLESHQAYVAPDAALAPLTRYQVKIIGTNNGAGFERNFIFTTGS